MMIHVAGTPAMPDLAPSQAELLAVFDGKYRRRPELGPAPKRRLSYNYFNPDDHYEAIVAKLVRPQSAWADVGCGRDVFPSNPDLARDLAQRCGFLFGVDPDPNIRINPFVHERFEGLIEDCPTTHRFDLITLRMVAEHVVEPDRSVAKLAELLKPGGLMVIYTPNKWSPVPIATALLPNRFHFSVKKHLWGGEERDTFPTAFKMNTRADLLRHCGRHGLSEVFFAYLDDCRTFGSFRWLNHLELSLQRATRSLSLRYPENCLLGVYRKT
jgi:SAM-dependent methyltransferase